MKTCHLSYEDLLYTHQNVRENVIMMIAEIFYWFELKRLPIVTGGGFPPPADRGDGRSTLDGVTITFIDSDYIMSV